MFLLFRSRDSGPLFRLHNFFCSPSAVRRREAHVQEMRELWSIMLVPPDSPTEESAPDRGLHAGIAGANNLSRLKSCFHGSPPKQVLHAGHGTSASLGHRDLCSNHRLASKYRALSDDGSSLRFRLPIPYASASGKGSPSPCLLTATDTVNLQTCSGLSRSHSAVPLPA